MLRSESFWIDDNNGNTREQKKPQERPKQYFKAESTATAIFFTHKPTICIIRCDDMVEKRIHSNDVIYRGLAIHLVIISNQTAIRLYNSRSHNFHQIQNK